MGPDATSIQEYSRRCRFRSRISTRVRVIVADSVCRGRASGAGVVRPPGRCSHSRNRRRHRCVLTTRVVNAIVRNDTCSHRGSYMAEQSIGEQELALLRLIADRGSLTVGEAADQFGAPRGLARSTVLTMMERLRGKGHLGRRLADGVYRYRARASSADLHEGRGSALRRTQPGSIGVAVSGLPVRRRTSLGRRARRTGRDRGQAQRRPRKGPVIAHGLHPCARFNRWRDPGRDHLAGLTPSAPPAGDTHRALVVRGGQVRRGAGVDDADPHSDSARRRCGRPLPSPSTSPPIPACGMTWPPAAPDVPRRSSVHCAARSLRCCTNGRRLPRSAGPSG